MEDVTDPDEAASTPFYCNLCKISCLSAANLQSHFMGWKHSKAERLLRNHGDSNPESPTKPAESLEDLLNACKDTEPAVGLQYIYEVQTDRQGITRGFQKTFFCTLCSCNQLPLAHMFMHITGAKHRITYLSKHHPSLGIPSYFYVKGGHATKRLQKLKEACIAVNKKFGSQKIKVVKATGMPWDTENVDPPPSTENEADSNLQKIDCTDEDLIGTDGKPKDPELEVDPPITNNEPDSNLQKIDCTNEDLIGTDGKPKDPELEVDPPPSTDNEADSNLQKIDSTNEDLIGTDGKPKDLERILTFLEIKAAKADLMIRAGRGSRSPDTMEQLEDDHNNKEITGDGGKEENNGKNKEVCSMDLAHHDPEEFTNNKEIIDFLGSFKIFKQDHMSFMLKVIEKLANALVQYKKCCEEMEEKKVSDCDKEEIHMNMDELPSLKRTHADQETTTNGQIQVPDSTTQSTSFPTHSTDKMHPVPKIRSTKPLFPAEQLNKMGPLTEKKQLVPSGSPSRIPQDSVTKDDQSQKFPAFKVNDKTPTNASSPERLQESTTSSNQKEIISAVPESFLRPDSTQDFATQDNQGENFPVYNIDHKASASAPRPDSPPDPKRQRIDKHPLFPVSMLEPITEINPLVPKAAQFSIPQDATKGNQRVEYPTFKVDNKTPTRTSTSDRPQDATKGNQRVEYPTFKVDNKTPTRTSTSDRPQDPERYPNNKKTVPVSQSEPVTETDPLVSRAAPFSIPHDSATKGNQRVEYPAFKVDHKAPTRAPTSYRPQDSATRGNQRVEYPAFKVDNKAPTRAPTSNRPQDSATKGIQRVEYPAFKVYNKAPTRAPTSDRPQDSATKGIQRVEYPAFKVYNKAPTRAPTSDRPQDSASQQPIQQNRDNRFEDRRAFNNPRPLFSSATSQPQELKQQSFSSLKVNRGAPTTQPRYPFPSGQSQHMSQHQQSNVVAQPKRTGSAPPRAPFPHMLLNQPAPRAVQPSLPVAQDEITAQFFESIKTMDVSEVVSTLNKITTTNPAFKGIHVPSLVQHLTETGKLKSSDTTQFKQ
ncbi:uncharacterized protein LOC134927810 isoform X2 [Pseudophryne corroboree]|uniref:uncharacterized protein LOC134927810 isoform X2 n=1 Tax=Pseudophryne corroboree TaxID=495146 RepID=UPI003081433A